MSTKRVYICTARPLAGCTTPPRLIETINNLPAVTARLVVTQMGKNNRRKIMSAAIDLCNETYPEFRKHTGGWGVSEPKEVYEIR